MTAKKKPAKAKKTKMLSKDLGLDGSFTMTATCPKCGYPGSPGGKYKGLYTPGKACPKCKFKEMVSWKTPSRAAQAVALELLTPPPEFQQILFLLNQNTLMIEQANKILKLLTKTLLDGHFDKRKPTR